jgi:hypothetical protein
MDANLVHKAGDTMTGQLNAKTVVVDGKLSDGSTAGWSLSVNNGYLRMNNNYIATLGTAFANDHATNKNYVDNLSYTQSINGLLSKFMDMAGLLFKISKITVTATETVIPITQDTSIVNNPNQSVITLNTNLFTPSSNGSNYTLYLVDES